MTLDGSDLAILVPMWGRAEKIPRLLRSIRRGTPAAEVWIIAGLDDQDVTNVMIDTQMRHAGLDAPPRFFGDPNVRWLQVPWRSGSLGDYGRKLNEGVRQSGIPPMGSNRPWVFLGAIDLCFCAGWYDVARAHARDGIEVVGTNDLCNARTARPPSGQQAAHSTHSLVSRRYIEEQGTIDEPGKVCHEGYPHEYVDDEFVRTARYRGVYAHAINAHVEHLHPMCGKAESDPLYRQQAERIRQGREVFLARQHLWGGTVQ